MPTIVADRKVTKADKPFSVRLNLTLQQRLEKFILRENRTRAEVIDRALEEYLDRREAQRQQHPGEQHKPRR